MQKDKVSRRVLIFPAGTEIGLEVFNALKYSRFVEVYGGTSLEDHSAYVYKRLIKGFPYYNSPDFIDYLNDIVRKYQIEYIYPAHDAVQLFLVEHSEEIDAEIVSTEKKTVEICRSKKRTYSYIKEKGYTWFLPRYYENIQEVEKYPVFVKPTIGQGSAGAEKIDDLELLRQKIKVSESEMVICEYLPGTEFTVECFTDKNEKLRLISMRNRTRIRMGIAVHSEILALDDDVKQIAECLNSIFKFSGAWFFQVKKNMSNEYKLLEISPRIPGTSGITRNKGINFPLLTLYNMWGTEIDLLWNTYDISVDRAFISRYSLKFDYDNIYVDFDDTLIVNQSVNTLLLAFLYQALEQGKKIILLTKHKDNILESLKKYCISSALFSEIYTLTDEQQKSDYIQSSNAIFIDDSFAERKRVAEKCNIPVMDLDMIESLIDWRK